MTKRIIASLIVLTTVGCASPPPLKVEPVTPQPPAPVGTTPPEAPLAVAVSTDGPGELSVEQKMNEKLAAPGPGVFVRVELDPAVIPTPKAAALVDALKSSLEKKGFVPDVASARQPSELTITSFEENLRRGIVLEWGLRRPNRRPLRWVRQIYVVRDTFDRVWPKFSAKVAEGFAALELPIHADLTAATAAAQACVPRFGFDADARGLVKSVVQSGPAYRAGLRPGDVIEGLDSRPPAFDRPDVDADVFERRVVVPIRFARAGTVVRGSLRAEVVCGQN